MRPTNSSPVVTRLLGAHGIVLGKTHLEELAEGLTTINPVYGPVLNPYNNLHDVGGQPLLSVSMFASRFTCARQAVSFSCQSVDAWPPAPRCPVSYWSRHSACEQRDRTI